MLSRRACLAGRQGQYIIEYAILIAIVAAACSGMVLYLRRAVQGQTKLVGDEYSEAGEGWGQGGSRAAGTVAREPDSVGDTGTGLPSGEGGSYSKTSAAVSAINATRQ